MCIIFNEALYLMDFGHRRCTSWILWSLNLDKLQNFILLLGIMQAAVSRRKRRACRRHCFFTGKDGSFGHCFSCHSTMYIHGSLQNWRYIFRFFPSPVALLARFAFAFACLKNNKPPFLQACCLSYSIFLWRMLWQSVWIYAILLISRDLS